MYQAPPPMTDPVAAGRRKTIRIAALELGLCAGLLWSAGVALDFWPLYHSRKLARLR